MQAALQPTDRVALVTGGARRIGAAVVRGLAQAGYAVAIHAHRSGEEAEALRAEIEAADGRAAVLITDLADHDAVTHLVGAAVAALGPLTLLVNNAGEFETDAFGALERARVERQFDVNLWAPLFLAQAFAAQARRDTDASIINIIDQRVFRPTPRFFSYTLAKSALYTATTTLAQALAPQVRVNGVAPGPTLPSPRQDAEAFARQAQLVPLGRGPSPDEIAAAVLYLAQARSVTGVTIAVDGGQHIAWQTPDAAEVDE
jgi:NAD(P)-dependent dehydrogenase (short-subunit alcohol dehydrogenase family)